MLRPCHESMWLVVSLPPPCPDVVGGLADYKVITWSGGLPANAP